MEKKDNYAIRREEAKKYFMRFEQQPLIDKFDLTHDDAYIYVKLFDCDYRINRKNGDMWWSRDGFRTEMPADFHEVLSVFDLLCHREYPPHAAGTFAPVNSLKGRPQTVGVDLDKTGTFAEYFDEHQAVFKKACEKIGGIPVSMGDIGYEFTVFKDLKVRIKFYGADEEFPASVMLLWDENTLEYMFYETTFYVMVILYQKIKKEMEMQSENMS